METALATARRVLAHQAEGLFTPLPGEESARRVRLARCLPQGGPLKSVDHVGSRRVMAGNAWFDLLDRDGATMGSCFVNEATVVDVKPSARAAGLFDLTATLWCEAGQVFTLNGRHIVDRDTFYCAIGEAINGPGGYFGWNLDHMAQWPSAKRTGAPPVLDPDWPPHLIGEETADWNSTAFNTGPVCLDHSSTGACAPDQEGSFAPEQWIATQLIPAIMWMSDSIDDGETMRGRFVTLWRVLSSPDGVCAGQNPPVRSRLSAGVMMCAGQ